MSEATLSLKFSGNVIDVGNIRDGRGIEMEVNGETVSITGLTTEETQAAAQHYGQTVSVEISTRPDSEALAAVPELRGKHAVVLYFQSQSDLDELVAAILELKPGMKAVQL